MLELRGITRRYGNFALNNLSFKVNRGEYFILLGRSGSGKSLTLELIAGIRKPEKGQVILNGTDITSLKMQRRKTGLVFQDFALFPHLTVYDNIAYPLKMKRTPDQDIHNMIDQIATEVNLKHLLERKPDSLSGGERQRVAVARTLIASPDIILLDEPMASIDTPLRDDIRRLLRRINGGGMTILHVTHDYREAIRLADRVGVIHNGRIIQIGKPDEVFSNPVNRFVARFAGIQNFFKVVINNDGSDSVATGRSGFRFLLSPGDYPQEAILMIHSNKITLSTKLSKVKDNSAWGEITEINRSEFGY
ncbi:MAG: ABC transporter ATP-binding protein, partial [Bacteroidales bacterium]|nr:ABC transporter ATP-binding protein [Bacteroidales bacterium]